MNITATFALSFRLRAALCCSAAVLLSACGGAADALDGQQPPTAMTACEIMEAPSAGTAGRADAGPPATGSVAQEPAAPGAVVQAADSGAAPAPAVAPAVTLAVAPTVGSSSAEGDLANAKGTALVPSNAALAASEFNLSGYQDAATASPSDPAAQGTTAASSVDGQ